VTTKPHSVQDDFAALRAEAEWRIPHVRAELDAAIDRIEEQLESALILLRRYEYLPAGSTLPPYPEQAGRECSCCGWPEGGHDGPGRYKGNAENTHEEGCSLDAVLHGRPAPRLASSPALRSE
jgi:hypothetical protein